jgi:hypothetical protein
MATVKILVRVMVSGAPNPFTPKMNRKKNTSGNPETQTPASLTTKKWGNDEEIFRWGVRSVHVFEWRCASPGDW